MSVALDSAIPLMNTDATTSGDTDRVFRKFIASMLMPDIKSLNPMAVRPGVLPHNWDASGCTSLRVQQQTTATMQVDILAGPGIIERTGQGPYLVYGESTVSVTIGTANATNPRIDVVYCWVGDQSLSGSTDTLHGPVIDVLQGVAASSPVARTDLPDGALALAQVRVEANATTIVASKITDTRMSTCVTGGVRRMLPGDKTSDVGRTDGELRYRKASSPYASLIDYWDASQSLWRGTQGFTLTGTFPGTPNGANLVSGTIPTSGSTLISVTITDPGFPYTIAGYATLQQTNNNSCNWLIRTSGGTFVSCIFNQGSAGVLQLIPIQNTVFTGSQTVVLAAAPIAGAATTWQADVRNKMFLRIDPA